MKKVSLLLTFMLFVSFVSYSQNINFDNLEFNYGTIKQDADGHAAFKFTNTGTKPLIITSVNSSCTCLVPTLPKEPIMPGEHNAIVVKYDTHRVGPISKVVTIKTNDPNQAEITLKVTGHVDPKSE